MTARRVPTIRERHATRPCWADLADSSQDCSRDDTHLVPPAPVGDDKSYDTPAVGVHSKGGLNSMLSRTALKGPIDFTFLMNDGGKNASQSSAGSTSPPQSAVASDSMASTCLATASLSSEARSWNTSATTFVPMASGAAAPSSPDMPPPAVPQADTATKSRRIRGKRTLSTLQAPTPAVKRPKEHCRDRDYKARDGTTDPPPPATEEEWQHRIAKRVKVVTSMKETREYQGYITTRSTGERLEGEPQTPTAEDRNLSKRRWEYEIQQWRTQLKQWAVDNLAPEEADNMQLDEVIRTPSPED